MHSFKNSDNVIYLDFDKGKFIINYNIKTIKIKFGLMNLFNVLHTCNMKTTTGYEGVLK